MHSEYHDEYHDDNFKIENDYSLDQLIYISQTYRYHLSVDFIVANFNPIRACYYSLFSSTASPTFQGDILFKWPLN